MNMEQIAALIIIASCANAVQSDAWAQSVSGSEGSQEFHRSVDVPDLLNRKIVSRSPRLESGKMRDLPTLDEAALERAFTTRSKSRGGDLNSFPPSERLRKMIREEIQSGGKGRQLPHERARDPAFSESDRTVFSPDDRVRIKDTTAYPFRVIGQLWSVDSRQQWGTCSATLIGPRAVLTAAHCLYDHESGGWLEDYEFYPAINGSRSSAPFGKFSWTDAFVLEGFISNYEGEYSSVIPWDIAVLILDRDAGNSLGWLGFSAYDPAYNLAANIVGYPGDKPESTMWRSTCDIDSSLADAFNFPYQCDIYGGSSGSAVYEYDPITKSRQILGVNIAESPVENIGIRLTPSNFTWVYERIAGH